MAQARVGALVLQKKGQREDGHIPGLQQVPGRDCPVRVLGFTQEGIQERAEVE